MLSSLSHCLTGFLESIPSWAWPGLASVGGINVIVGLWMECTAEDDKPRNKLGEILVIIGVGLEVIIGFALAAKDVIEQNKTAAQIASIDPLNQPIVTVSAMVDLWTEGTTPENSKFPPKEISSTQLAFGSPSEETHGAPTLFFSHANFVNRTNSQTEWLFVFNQELLAFSFPNKFVRDSTNWSVFELSVRFLPPGTQVTKGTINLTVNLTNIVETILPQKVKNHSSDWKIYTNNPTAGVTVFGQ